MGIENCKSGSLSECYWQSLGAPKFVSREDLFDATYNLLEKEYNFHYSFYHNKWIKGVCYGALNCMVLHNFQGGGAIIPLDVSSGLFLGVYHIFWGYTHDFFVGLGKWI